MGECSTREDWERQEHSEGQADEEDEKGNNRWDKDNKPTKPAAVTCRLLLRF